MRTNNVTPVLFTGINPVVIKPKYKKNINKPYLYNDVLDITKDFRVGAVFHNNKIELPSPTKEIIEKLRSLGIAYTYKKTK